MRIELFWILVLAAIVGPGVRSQEVPLVGDGFRLQSVTESGSKLTIQVDRVDPGTIRGVVDRALTRAGADGVRPSRVTILEVRRDLVLCFSYAVDYPPRLAPPMGGDRGEITGAVLDLDPMTFDQNVFGSLSPDDRRSRLADFLTTDVHEARRKHALTPAEVVKLRLAGGLDINRFLGRIEAERREFDEARRELRSGIAAVRRLALLRGDFEQARFNGEDTAFSKVLAKILADREAAEKGDKD